MTSIRPIKLLVPSCDCSCSRLSVQYTSPPEGSQVALTAEEPEGDWTS